MASLIDDTQIVFGGFRLPVSPAAGRFGGGAGAGGADSGEGGEGGEDGGSSVCDDGAHGSVKNAIFFHYQAPHAPAISRARAVADRVSAQRALHSTCLAIQIDEASECEALTQLRAALAAEMIYDDDPPPTVATAATAVGDRASDGDASGDGHDDHVPRACAGGCVGTVVTGGVGVRHERRRSVNSGSGGSLLPLLSRIGKSVSELSVGSFDVERGYVDHPGEFTVENPARWSAAPFSRAARGYGAPGGGFASCDSIDFDLDHDIATMPLESNEDGGHCDDDDDTRLARQRINHAQRGVSGDKEIVNARGLDLGEFGRPDRSASLHHDTGGDGGGDRGNGTDIGVQLLFRVSVNPMHFQAGARRWDAKPTKCGLLWTKARSKENWVRRR
jgi:hypothetical protein